MVSIDSGIYLQSSIKQLRESVLIQNFPGSVEGLLIFHILKNVKALEIEWNVFCSEKWIEENYKPTMLDHVAALGFMYWEEQNPNYKANLLDGLNRVTDRDAFKGGHLSIANSPSRLLGIILGSLALKSEGEKALAWCKDVLNKMGQKDMLNFDPLVKYLLYLVFNKKISVDVDESSLYQQSFSDWVFRNNFFEATPSQEVLENYQQKILYLSATNLKFETAIQAAFIWLSIDKILFGAFSSSILQPIHVAEILENFEAAMRRWRWDSEKLKKPIQWPITQEREVQDILWVILRSYFPDVVDEDTLPKLGHSSYIADFGIESLKLIIEVKYARSKDDFKTIEKEVQEDCIPYLRDTRYESLIVFIYDASSSVQEHEVTRRALLEIPGMVDVVIVCKPSQLPSK